MSETVDLSLYPLIRITVPEELSPAFVARLYEQLEPIYERGGHYVTVVDGTPVRRMPDALTRRALTEMPPKLERHVRKWSLGTAIVITSSLARGAHTALHWLRVDKYAVPEVAVSTLAEAHGWAVAQLESKDAMTDAIRQLVTG